RRQLEQVQGLAKDASATAASPSKQDSADDNGVRHLERQVAQRSKHSVFLDTVLRQLTPDFPVKEPASLPKQLTFRARRILEQGRKLLGQLRSLADGFEPSPYA